MFIISQNVHFCTPVDMRCYFFSNKFDSICFSDYILLSFALVFAPLYPFYNAAATRVTAGLDLGWPWYKRAPVKLIQVGWPGILTQVSHRVEHSSLRCWRVAVHTSAHMLGCCGVDLATTGYMSAVWKRGDPGSVPGSQYKSIINLGHLYLGLSRGQWSCHSVITIPNLLLYWDYLTDEFFSS